MVANVVEMIKTKTDIKKIDARMSRKTLPDLEKIDARMSRKTLPDLEKRE